MSQKENQKQWNINLTKKEQLKRIYELEENGKIVLEANKQRINISIHSALWNRIDSVTSNKSQLVETLLKKYLEEYEGKEIILRRAEL